MASDLHGYYKGFAEGYRAGLADGLAGKSRLEDLEDILSRPTAFLVLSVRARNCLDRAGCATVGDVATLTEEEILRMRNLGWKTAREIAIALWAHDIRPTCWDGFLD